jgi:hypothetical protein
MEHVDATATFLLETGWAGQLPLQYMEELDQRIKMLRQERFLLW